MYGHGVMYMLREALVLAFAFGFVCVCVCVCVCVSVYVSSYAVDVEA